MDYRGSPRKVVLDTSTTGASIAERIVTFVEAISLAHNGSIVRGKKAPAFGSMVDVGCGDGHSTLQFAPYFKNVTGIDKSKSQIAKAKENIAKHPPVSRASIAFDVASGERMPFPDSSQDLVCFSRSFHWMELMSGALREVRRVLKPTGCLAMYCTGFPKIERQISSGEEAQSGGRVHAEGKKKANEMLDNFFRNACEMHPRCALAVDDRYRRIYESITVDNVARSRGSKVIVIDDVNMALRKQYVTLTEFGEMLRAYAGYRCAKLALKRMGSKKNPLEDLLEDLKCIWSTEDCSNDEIFLNITWDVSLILSTRPAKIK